MGHIAFGFSALTCKSAEEVAGEGIGEPNSGIVLLGSRDGAEVLARLGVLASAPHCLPWASKVEFLRFVAPAIVVAVATPEVEPPATFALAEDDACGRVSTLRFWHKKRSLTMVWILPLPSVLCAFSSALSGSLYVAFWLGAARPG